MKSSVRITVITLSLVLVAPVPAYAQKTSATINIPFSFTVDDVRLPAGAGQVVELRFFGGLSVEETAELMNISPATVKRDWSMAKAWLARELRKAQNNSAENQCTG